MNERAKILLLGLVLLVGVLSVRERDRIQETIRTFTSRGVRNNNPGNLRLTNIPWRGKVPAAQNTDGDFEQFFEASDGIRALGVDLGSKFRRGLDTIRKIITVYAPPVENDTEAYIRSVSRQTGLEADQVINVELEKFSLVGAIILHENGENPYPEPFIREALAS